VNCAGDGEVMLDEQQRSIVIVPSAAITMNDGTATPDAQSLIREPYWRS
jgi:hypothetical protein